MEQSGRNRWQPVAAERAPRSGSNKPKSLPPVATSCRSGRTVRRGSTVRVRQRAFVCLQALLVTGALLGSHSQELVATDEDLVSVRDDLRFAELKGQGQAPICCRQGPP
jgi:hypothetical protein